LLGALTTLIVSLTLFVQLQSRATKSARDAALLPAIAGFGSMDAEQPFNEIPVMRDQLAQLSSALAGISHVPPEAKVSAAVGELSQKAEQLSARLKLLEDAILETPDKALSIPLLRKDLENQRTMAANDSAAIRQEIAQISDLNKWFVALIATMALSMLTFAASSFFKKGSGDR
jgi:hypothetical protein